MTGITIRGFDGIAPSIAPKQLGESMAQVSSNARLSSNRLESWKGLLDTAAAPLDVKSIFKYQGAWKTYQEDVDMVGSLLSNDVHERIYITDGVYPKILSGSSSYRLGLPKPATNPTTTVVTVGTTTNPLSVQTVSYVCTLVDVWGTEGPPSGASSEQEIGEGFQVDVSLPGAPTGNWNLSTGSLVRIYRSNTGSGGAQYQFVAEVALGTATYSDTTPSEDLLEVLPSTSWLGPPDDDAALYPSGPLRGLIEVPGGMLAGFTGNAVRVSEPYLPNAWPVENEWSSADKVVGIVYISLGILVVTEGKPYIIAGHEPVSMTMLTIESNAPCVSKRSIVDLGEAAVYASPDGLIMASQAGLQMITKEYIDRDTWQTSYSPSTMRAWEYEGMYVAFYGAVDNNTGFVFDPAQGAKGLMPIAGKVDAGWYDIANDALYVGYKQSPTVWRIGQFNAGSDLAYSWTSKQFITPRPVSMSTIRVEADSYPLTVKLTGDGSLRDTISITSDNAQRLSGGYRAKVWELTVEGSVPVDMVGVWDAMEEVE